MEHISTVVLNKKTILKTSICGNCALVWRSTRPSLSWFQYAWGERDAQDDSDLEEPTLSAAQVSGKRQPIKYKTIASLLDQITAGKAHLDIGTGTGLGLKHFIDRGFRSVGLEPDVARAKLGQANGRPVENLTLEDFVEKGSHDKYDLVTAIHVLEHKQNPILFFETCKHLLSEEGLLCVEVPDARNYIYWKDNLYMEHLYNFSFANLVHAANKAGLFAKYYLSHKTMPFGPKHLLVVFSRKGNSDQIDLNDSKNRKRAYIDRLKALHVSGLPKRIHIPLQYHLQNFDGIRFVSKNLNFGYQGNGQFIQNKRQSGKMRSQIQSLMGAHRQGGYAGVKNRILGKLVNNFPNIVHDKELLPQTLSKIDENLIETQMW